MDGGRQIEAKMLIDRKNDYYHINNSSLHFPLLEGTDQSFHTETLLDGELVLDIMPNGDQRNTYLVFDCLALRGKPLLQKTLDKRLGLFYQEVYGPYKSLLDRYPEEKENQPFTIIPKKMEKAYGIEMMFRDILPNLAHGNDGLIFTCKTSPYVIGTDHGILKWKPPHENTIDFRLQLGDFPTTEIDGEECQDFDARPVFNLLVYYGGHRNEHFAELFLTPFEWEMLKGMNQILDGRIVECFRDREGRWRLKVEADGTPRFRDDKTEANHIRTVESVLESIGDAVSEQDLLNVARAIYGKSKQREAGAFRAMERRTGRINDGQGTAERL